MRCTHCGAEEDQWHDENCRINYVEILVALTEELLIRVPGLSHDFFVELITGQEPFDPSRTRK